VVHNTSAPRLLQWHSHPGEVRMRNLESYYRDQQRWSAGPHLFVADDLIWVFTPLTTSGVHSPSWNGVAWGVELVGEYDIEPFNPGVRENAVDALAALYTCRGLDLLEELPNLALFVLAFGSARISYLQDIPAAPKLYNGGAVL
jgi:hypothetical protein